MGAGVSSPQSGDESESYDASVTQKRVFFLPSAPSGLKARLARLGARPGEVDPAAFDLMKPQPADRPFSRAGWLFELKYDGYRMVARGGAGEARLYLRSGREATPIFPDVAAAVAALPWPEVVVDGEVAVLDAEGRPSFKRLQQRAQLTRAADAARAAKAAPARLFAFDFLAACGYDLRPLPLATRKELLRELLDGSTGIRLLDHVETRGEDLFAAVEAMGLEGIVAKRADSPYRSGYSPDWLKVRIDQTDDFAVVGFEPVPRGSTGVRNLHVAASDEGTLAYAGTVGSGFTVAGANQLRALLEPLRRAAPALAVPAVKGAVWVEPKVMVELRFKEKTENGSLRHPVFLRVRDDKTVLDPRPPLTLTNLDKVFWPGEGITKGDLLDYYRGVAAWMLPYLAERPVVIDRYPDGIAGKSFFQKNAPEAVAGRVRTVPIETSERTIEAFLVDDVEALLCLVNLGAIPFHVWSSRVGALDRPDWCILDFDPKGAPFAHVARLARAAHGLCRQAGLPAYVKTSGGSGLHVLLPLGGQLGHEQSRQLAELLAQLIVHEHPDLATTARAIPARRGRVYVDAYQNGRGKLIAAPYTVRPHPGAPVSTPLAWKEVEEDLQVGELNVKTLPARLQRLKKDPLRPVLGERPDLEAALAELARR